VETYAYNEADRLTHWQSGYDYKDYTYDPRGNLLKVTGNDPLGWFGGYVWDGPGYWNGLVGNSVYGSTVITNAYANTVSPNVYGAAGTAAGTDAAGATANLFGSAADSFSWWFWPNWNGSKDRNDREYGVRTLELYSWNEAGRLVKQTNWRGGITRYGYDGDGNRLSMTTSYDKDLDWYWSHRDIGDVGLSDDERGHGIFAGFPGLGGNQNNHGGFGLFGLFGWWGNNRGNGDNNGRNDYNNDYNNWWNDDSRWNSFTFGDPWERWNWGDHREQLLDRSTYTNDVSSPLPVVLQVTSTGYNGHPDPWRTTYTYGAGQELVSMTNPGTVEGFDSRNGNGFFDDWHGHQVPNTSYYVQDALGSPIAMLDQKGHVTGRAQYDEFGNLEAASTGNGLGYGDYRGDGKWRGYGHGFDFGYDYGYGYTSSKGYSNTFGGLLDQDVLGDGNVFGYTGLQYDESTGLNYARARYYSPQMGRFISEDMYKGSIWEPQLQNLYKYVSNNPLRYIDPSGHLQDSDEKYKTSNPFVYGQLEFLTKLYEAAGTEVPNKSMQDQIHATADYLRYVADSGANYAIVSLDTFLPVDSGKAPICAFTCGSIINRDAIFRGDGTDRQFGVNQLNVRTLQYAVVNLDYNSLVGLNYNGVTHRIDESNHVLDAGRVGNENMYWTQYNMNYQGNSNFTDIGATTHSGNPLVLGAPDIDYYAHITITDKKEVNVSLSLISSQLMKVILASTVDSLIRCTNLNLFGRIPMVLCNQVILTDFLGSIVVVHLQKV
jgi:RHS repeat-associated protein